MFFIFYKHTWVFIGWGEATTPFSRVSYGSASASTRRFCLTGPGKPPGMGVMGMQRYLSDHGLIEPMRCNYAEVRGVKVAVDVWNVVHLLLRRVDAFVGQFERKRLNYWCLMTLFQVLNKKQFVPVFVFDGMYDIFCCAPSGNGAKAIARRQRKASRKTETLSQSPSASTPVTPFATLDDHRRKRPTYRFCRRLIEAAGYPIVAVPGYEADESCANLFHTGAVDYVISGDTDLLLMGCDLILDPLPMFPPVVRYRVLLKHLGMESDDFLSHFVRCHTDLHSSAQLVSFEQALEQWWGPRDGERDVGPHIIESERLFVEQVRRLVKPVSLPSDRKLLLLKRVPLSRGVAPDIDTLMEIVAKYDPDKLQKHLDDFIERYAYMRVSDLYVRVIAAD